MKYLFIDESGDHNLLPKKIDPTFPLFVLTGIVFEEGEYKKFQKALISFKKEIFGTSKVILHALELTRTSNAKQKEFRQLADKTFRNNFYNKLNNLLQKHTWSCFAFVIDKPNFSKLFGAQAPDPYFLSFSDIISRYEKKLKPKERGEIYVEHRNKILDKQFLLAWESAKTSRVGLVTDKQLVAHHIEKPEICKKSWELSGLEIADLVSYRVSRSFMGKQTKPIGNEIDLNVINAKGLEVVAVPSMPHNPSKKVQ